MSSPERREEARHLDDDELAAIWARYSALHDIFEGIATTYPDDRLAAARDVAALVGEVARLRAALGPLVERPPIAHDRMEAAHCAYCEGYLDFGKQEHAPDCPWLLAAAALATGGPRAPQRQQEES